MGRFHKSLTQKHFRRDLGSHGLKGPNYPAAQRDRAKLVLVAPCGTAAALTDLSIDRSRLAIVTCCFLADHEVGQEWIVTQEVRRSIEAAWLPGK